MADTPKVLGQLNPSATTLDDLYVVPAATNIVSSSIVVCNTGGTDTTFRISIAIVGAADNIKQYIYYDVPISAKDTFIATIGITLEATDKIRVYAGNANLTFNLFGTEIA